MVFVTKYRHQVFTAAHLDRMEEILRDVCADLGCELAEFNGEPDHVHLLVNFPPTVAISRLVNSLMGVSSRCLRQEFPDLRRLRWRAQRLWAGSASRARPVVHRSLPCASTSTAGPAPLVGPSRQPEGQRIGGHLSSFPEIPIPKIAG